MPSDNNNLFFNWVLIAKGIGIILVVVGHFYPPDSPQVWGELRRLIYTFHMPLFFMLSGFLYSHAKHDYAELIEGKIKRLGYPFLSIAALFFVVKYLAGLLFPLEHPVGGEQLWALLVNPVHSYMPLLWFVHALFLIFLVYPLSRMVIGSNVALLLLFVLINVLFGSRYPVVGNALANIPFFIAGVMLRENAALRGGFISGSWLNIAAALILLVVTFLLMQKMYGSNQAGYLMVLTAGITGAVFIMNISRLIDDVGKGAGKSILLETGMYSMTIYLFHTLFQSAVEFGLYRLLGDIRFGFGILAAAAISAGVVFPLLLEKAILRKNRIARKYVLGL